VDRRRVSRLALQAGFAPIPHDRVEETEIGGR
jgi:hypothetical protein